MKRLFLPAIIAMVAFAVTACTDYDNDYSERGLAFEKGFNEMFANVDPNHNWNTAVQNHVTVAIPEGQYTVKMYTENPRYAKSRAYMLAQYDDVNGGTSRTFDVDMPGNLGTVYVALINKNGDRIILPSVINGDKASVSFPKIQAPMAGTRTVFTPSDGKEGYDDSWSDYHATAEKWTFGYDEILPVLQTLPEKKNNVGAVTQNLCYVSMGEFTIYPMYSVTDNQGKYSKGLVLGVYYYDALGNKHNVDIWQKENLSDDNTWLEVFSTNEYGTAMVNGEKGTWAKTPNYVSDCFTFAEGTGSGVKGVPTGWSGNYKALRSQGITVNLPVGTKFGFYLGINSHGNMYSESALNEGQSSHDGFQCYAASFHDDGELFLCFEDWHYSSSSSDRDFNDIVFGFHGSKATPVIIDKDVEVATMSYIIACEDLGTVGAVDFDYNDVVFAIQHASGSDKAKVQLRAAGGTCPIYLTYNGENIMFKNKKAGSGTTNNIHAAFGFDDDIMINTKALGGKSADFVMSEEITVDPNAFTVTDDASKFGVHVQYKDGTVGDEITIPDLTKEHNTKPQAFLVADPDWIWPLEKQNITSAYSGFTDWVTNHLRTNWYDSVWQTINENKTVPSGATDILTAPGSVTYTTSGNVATVTIPKACFAADQTYKLVIKPTEDCQVAFKHGGDTWDIMPSGTVQAGRVTTFTFNAAATNAVVGGSGDVVVTFTFASTVDAASAIETLYWTGQTGSSSGDVPGAPDYGVELTVTSDSYGGRIAVADIVSALGALSDDDELAFTIQLDGASNMDGTFVANETGVYSGTPIWGADYSMANEYKKTVEYSKIKNYSYIFLKAYSASISKVYVKKN